MEKLHRAPRREPGGGVLVGVPQTDGSLPGFATELKELADANKIPVASDYSAKYSSQELSAAAAIPREMGAHRYCYFISRHPC